MVELEWNMPEKRPEDGAKILMKSMYGINGVYYYDAGKDIIEDNKWSYDWEAVRGWVEFERVMESIKNPVLDIDYKLSEQADSILSQMELLGFETLKLFVVGMIGKLIAYDGKNEVNHRLLEMSDMSREVIYRDINDLLDKGYLKELFESGNNGYYEVTGNGWGYIKEKNGKQ